MLRIIIISLLLTISAFAQQGSPLTTKGDIYGYDTGNARVPVGADGLCLVSDSTNALGLKWGSCLVAGVPNISGGNFQIGNGTSLSPTGTGSITANKIMVPIAQGTGTVLYNNGNGTANPVAAAANFNIDLSNGVPLHYPSPSPGLLDEMAYAAAIGGGGYFLQTESFSGPYGPSFCFAESLTQNGLGICAIQIGGLQNIYHMSIGIGVDQLDFPSSLRVNNPDGGKFTSSGLQLGSGGPPTNTGLTIVPSSLNHLPIPASTSYGALSMGVEETLYPFIDATGAPNSGSLGAVIKGWNAPCTGCNVRSMDNDITILDSYGNPVFGTIFGINSPLFGLGVGRGVVCAPVNEGCPLLTQFVLQDQPIGTLGAPWLTMQSNQGAGGVNLGIGWTSPSNNDLRYGCVENQITPWSDQSTCIATVDVLSGFRTGFSNISATVNSGGAGFTPDIWLRDVNQNTGGIFGIMNHDGTGFMPLQASQFISPNVTLQSAPGDICSSSTPGQINYVAGGPGTKDAVQICAKDASDVWAWRTIY